MKKPEPMRNINPFGLRLQPEIKAKLEEAAERNKRSLNAEISARLEESFSLQDLTPHEATMQTLIALYHESLDSIKKLENSTRLSKMEETELAYEKEAAKHLRHTIAKASSSL